MVYLIVENMAAWIEDLTVLALLLDEEEEQEQKRRKQRRWSVHPMWKKRQTEGEFKIYRKLLDDETKFHEYFRMSQYSFNILLDKIKYRLEKQLTSHTDLAQRTFDCLFKSLDCFVLVENAALVCQKKRYTVTVRVSEEQPYQIREYVWCLNFPPRCSKYKIKFKTVYKTQNLVKSRPIEECCKGYAKNTAEDGCIPVCSKNCKHGACVSPDTCQIGINRAGPSTDTDDDEVKKARIDLCSAPSAAAARTGYDIGKYVCHPPSNDEEKLRALKEPWIPPDTFKFPVTDTGKKKLSFQRHWTNRYSWLVYSNLMQGALCKVCVLLGKTQGGRGHQELGAFVSKPFINWKKALESFDHHADTKYHKFAVEQAANFARIMEGKTLDVTECLNVENNKIAEENRKRLKAIVETIILCGRQAIALRGSHDSGEIGINEPEHNDGNFRALLRFRARSGDEALKNHLLTQNIHSRAMYTSSVIQNEVIELCGSAIQTQVLNRVKEAGFFTILADETQDISRREQLALCLRYVHCSSGKSVIQEDFLEFIHVEDVSAQALATTIISHLLSYNLDMDKWIGQGYDGAAVMSGRLRGVRTIISEQYPKAQFVHCVAHVLNLVLAHSCEIPMIRNCIGTIKSVINFFRQSPLRDGLLKKIADQINSSHSTLISLCETRWTEKHVAVERFAEMVPVIRETLGALQDAASSDVATQAYHLQTAMDNSQFIVSLVILRKVFSYTANLNKAMQKVNVDLTNICEYTKTVKTTLLNVRNESQFAILFEQAQQMSSGDIVVPRITGRQTLRNNIAAETAEIYYRRNVFYPFIDHVIAELDARFKPHESTIEGIQMLLPEKTSNDSRIKENLEKIAQTFLGGENEGTIFLSEYEIWHNHWKSVAQKPATVLDAIDNCDDQFFPSIKKLLIILATLPVSTATPERSFSTLKRLKTYLRNKMGDERLTGLALMSVHRDLAVQLDSEEIINQLAIKRRRLNLLF
ncbi:unnamed protein product [Acanthoscelides obtectus]|uniref:EMI domain-containing protein n=1 Tax=Acanthoscelides obtectus TaxID=200917 RepID=A0A9P0LEZ9_ACAOB|nr:unnamed protein product [Acanthoscelides obtectus]CAK1655736.1 Zinc finger MYM-type protein 1 [Acanthoscelides obtectus]